MAIQENPFTGFNFIVEIAGVAAAGFAECSGLNTETEVIEYRTGSEDITVRKIPGLKKFTNITLKRGITLNRELWEWRKKVLDGHTERTDGSIIMLNEERQEVLRFTFRAGWPVKWEGPLLNATSNEIAIETLEIAHEGLNWD
jgi:phage tail-like protein